jgi:ethanolamine ammonia-lyase small subunit
MTEASGALPSVSGAMADGSRVVPDASGVVRDATGVRADAGNVRTVAAEPAEAAWSRLRALTSARIGLARSGASLATGPLLEFRLAHARARDAVHAELDDARLAADAAGLGLPVVTLTSAAADRRTYLMRPDLGRRLAAGNEAALAPGVGEYDLAIVLVDGLSARAVEDHAIPVLAGALPGLRAAGWRIAPLVIVRQGRVAIGDAIAACLGAAAVAVLIGERPGLSAPDSLGAYLTWRPRPDSTDADRNCISNIRPEGIGAGDAAFKLVFLLREMRARGVSGVALKDQSGGAAVAGIAG